MLPSCREILDDESGAAGTEYISIAAIVSFAALPFSASWRGIGPVPACFKHGTW